MKNKCLKHTPSAGGQGEVGNECIYEETAVIQKATVVKSNQILWLKLCIFSTEMMPKLDKIFSLETAKLEPSPYLYLEPK